MNKIPVIDDEPGIRKSFLLAPDNEDITADTAENGEKGLELFAENEYRIVFPDLKMPGLNGVDVLTEIRKQNRNVPVYLVTVFHKEFFGQLNEARNPGCNFELLQKPIKADTVLKLT